MDDDRDADDAVAGLDGKNGWKVGSGEVGQWRVMAVCSLAGQWWRREQPCLPACLPWLGSTCTSGLLFPLTSTPALVPPCLQVERARPSRRDAGGGGGYGGGGGDRYGGGGDRYGGGGGDRYGGGGGGDRPAYGQSKCYACGEVRAAGLPGCIPCTFLCSPACLHHQ